MEVLKLCPICEGNKISTYLSCIDYTVSRETYEIVKCDQCGFLFTNPRPSTSDIGKFYLSDEYISHSATKKGLMNSVYHFVRNYTIKRKYNLVSKHSGNQASLLDIGSGTGEFLHFAKLKGSKVIGIEPSEVGRQAAISNYQLEIHTEDYLDCIPKNSFDAITMWHVLEHVHDLNGRVDQIYSLLKPPGKAFIAVPNYVSYDAQFYNRSWAAYDVPRHLYHFDKQSISRLFEKHKMKLISILPMKMDAFYVSMLSEKYKNGKINYLSALLNGWRSNSKAGSHPDRYSSVIYIFSK
jgi:2-polyprenyl-3-methyl-5-hydroxy-6-metoxy-1,4-benzoquinol methylase